MKGFGIALVATLGACLGVGFVASPAQAQTPSPAICGDLFELCKIADDVYDMNVENFLEFFPLDEKTCSQMADSVQAQCEHGVKAGVKCWTAQFESIPKNARPACKSERSPTSDCNVEFKYNAKNNVNFARARGGFETGCCEDVASDFFDLCLGDV
jgi:hypothetical protein